jgi:hypothetical protein
MDASSLPSSGPSCVASPLHPKPLSNFICTYLFIIYSLFVSWAAASAAAFVVFSRTRFTEHVHKMLLFLFYFSGIVKRRRNSCRIRAGTGARVCRPANFPRSRRRAFCSCSPFPHFLLISHSAQKVRPAHPQAESTHVLGKPRVTLPTTDGSREKRTSCIERKKQQFSSARPQKFLHPSILSLLSSSRAHPPNNP